MIDLTNEYQLDEDVIGRFVEERCALGAHAKARANVIYKAYKEFCKDEGIDDPAGPNTLADALKQISYDKGNKFVDKRRDGAGRYYVGIGLDAPTDEDPRMPDDGPENWGF